QAWHWAKNPFIDSKGQQTEELSFLALQEILTQDWDSTDINTGLAAIPGTKGNLEIWYYLGDVGQTFGKASSLKGFSIDQFEGLPSLISSIDMKASASSDGPGVLHPNYGNAGRARPGNTHKNIPLPHAKAFAEVIKLFTDQQLHDAFSAGFGTRQP